MPEIQARRVQLAIEFIAGVVPTQAALRGLAWLLALSMLLLLPRPADARPVPQLQSGVVTRVVDGDTLWVQTAMDGKPLKVRISGIDAPEICQVGGMEARDALKRRVLRQQVTISFQRHDDYGRALARVEWQGEDIGHWMVINGHAWSYSYRRSPGPYAVEQSRAMLARRGLFAIGEAENPRSFRRRHGSCYP